MFDEEDLDIWFDDESGSHWFRRLVFLIASAAIVYYYSRAKSRQLDADETESTFVAETEPEVEVQQSVDDEPEVEEEELVDDELEDEEELEATTQLQGVETEAVVDVIAAEFSITDDEYVIDDEEEITEDTEIDLALEEAIENGDLDDDESGDDPLEGVLAESDDEDLEEQVLEPSPAPDEPPKWVAPIDGECPDGHPVKARFSTGRYHVPGDRGYEKIVPDCCYKNTDDAKADGFTHSRWS